MVIWLVLLDRSNVTVLLNTIVGSPSCVPVEIESGNITKDPQPCGLSQTFRLKRVCGVTKMIYKAMA